MKGRTIIAALLMTGTFFYFMISIFVLYQKRPLNWENEIKETLTAYWEEEHLKLSVWNKDFNLFLEETFHAPSLETTCNIIAEKLLIIRETEEIKDKDFTYYILERKKEREFIKKYSVNGRIGYTK